VKFTVGAGAAVCAKAGDRAASEADRAKAAIRDLVTRFSL